MAKFLKDSRISNIRINEEAIIQLNNIFHSRMEALRNTSGIINEEQEQYILTYILRFDDKGYRLFTVKEVLEYFFRSKHVERLVLTIETIQSLKTNRISGELIELRFDKENESNCILSVTSDDSDWVDSSFSAVQEILKKYKTYYGWARSAYSTLAIQILGIIGGFSLSLWAASAISRKLIIENAFIITFLFILLLFSNTWIYVNNAVLKYIHRTFPNIHFYRPNKGKANWLMQAIIGGLATGLAIYILNGLFSYIGSFLEKFIIKT